MKFSFIRFIIIPIITLIALSAGFAELMKSSDDRELEMKDSEPILDDPIRAFEELTSNVRILTVTKDPSIQIPEGGHLQGIQSAYDPHSKSWLFFITGSSSTKAYFIIASFDQKWPDSGHVSDCVFLPSDGVTPPLKHAGGCQIVDGILVVGVEDNQYKKRSEIQFWDVSSVKKPMECPHLTIVRESKVEKVKTAGAVGIVKQGDIYLLAVANWDAEAIDFYRSNGFPLRNEQCQFDNEPFLTWKQEKADRSDWKPDKNWGSYQSINLFSDRSNALYLCGFTGNEGQDFIDLYSIDLNKTPERIIQKIARKQIPLKNGASFQYGGGLFFKSPSNLEILSCERNVQETVLINIVSH